MSSWPPSSPYYDEDDHAVVAKKERKPMSFSQKVQVVFIFTVAVPALAVLWALAAGAGWADIGHFIVGTGRFVLLGAASICVFFWYLDATE